MNSNESSSIFDRSLTLGDLQTPSPSNGAAAAFPRMRGRLYHAVATDDLAAEEMARLVESPELTFDSPRARVVKRGRSALIVKAPLRLREGETSAAVKRLGSRNWIRRLAKGLQPDRATRNFYLGHELKSRGIATPRPLLAIAPKWRVFLRPPVFATEWVEGAVPIDVFLRSIAVLAAGRRTTLMRAAAERLGHLVGRLHACGFSHRDLKATNLLVREQQGRIDVFVIDLDGVSRLRFLRERKQLQNLARLVVAIEGQTGVTRALFLRALRAYLAVISHPPAWKAVWRQLAEVSRIRRLRRTRRAQPGPAGLGRRVA